MPDALTRLLRGTGFGARVKDGAYYITATPRPIGELVGRITTANGEPNTGTRIIIPDLRRATKTNRHGEYSFENIPLGTFLVVVNRTGFQPIHISDVQVTASPRTYLAPIVLRPAYETNQLEPVIVEGRLNRRGPLDPGPTVWGPRQAGRNFDLTRTINDALPYLIYDRDRITRSGVVNLNDFLRLELLDTDTTSLPPDQNGDGDLFSGGSSNLNLRDSARTKPSSWSTVDVCPKYSRQWALRAPATDTNLRM
ncbi:MAG: carboxypeptidase regulatory-like domain-containing protein [Candidatus Synoicihabitans palmerolidicus]|nr:carboxypeptidase regulatory-like domain-containing protein [Candidatus Synoicihabitans palmerolidicus]